MDPLGRIHSVEVRHGDIENGNVRRGRLRLFHSFAAVRRFGNHAEAGLGFKQQPKSPAHDDVVVGEENSNWIHVRTRSCGTSSGTPSV